MMKLKYLWLYFIAIREKVSSDQEQVQSEPKDCPHKINVKLLKLHKRQITTRLLW